MAQVRATLSKGRAPADMAILSSENFCTLDCRRLALLAEVLQDWDVGIVYFLRHLGGFWVSHWQEMIKYGGDITFSESLAQASAPDRLPRSRISQVEQLEKLAEYSGREGICIVAYNNVLGEKQDLYDYSVRMTVGIEPRNRGGDERVNRSFCSQRVELLRALNTTYRRARGRHRRVLDCAKPTCAGPDASRPQTSSDLLPPLSVLTVNTIRLLRTGSRSAREQELLSKFGDRIVDKSSDRSIFHEPPPWQARFVSRMWVSEAGQAERFGMVAHSLVAQMEEDGAVCS
jgi:hypothetical protein